MHRFLGLGLLLLGMVGGWMLGAPDAPEERLEISPAAAWNYYRAERAASRVFKHDIPPHPAAVAALLAGASLGLLLAASSHPRRALEAAVWLRPHPSVHWN